MTASPPSPVQPTVNKSPLPVLPRDLNEAILGHPGLKPVNNYLSNEMYGYLAQRRIAVAGSVALSDNISYTSLTSDNEA